MKRKKNQYFTSWHSYISELWIIDTHLATSNVTSVFKKKQQKKLRYNGEYHLNRNVIDLETSHKFVDI